MSADDRGGTSSAGPSAEPGPGDGLRRWRALTAVATVATFLLIVLGGVVRITGSGMGCGDDWPLCHGRLIPTMGLATFLEWSHRLAAAGVGLLVAAVSVGAWWPGRGAAWRPYRKLSAAAAVLLVVQVLLGAVTVRLELPPASVMLHLGTALLLLTVLLVAWCRSAGDRARPARRDAAAGWTWIAAAFAFVVVLAGGFVANLDAAAACSGFPLCGGSPWPAGWRAHVHWMHRLLAYVLVLGLPAVALYVRARRPDDAAARRWTAAAALAAVAQLVVGAVMVTGGFTTAVRALHVTLGTGVFALLVVAGWMVSRRRIGAEGTPRA